MFKLVKRKNLKNKLFISIALVLIIAALSILLMSLYIKQTIISKTNLNKQNEYQTTATVNGIKWSYTLKDGEAINVYYDSGNLGETVTIPSYLDGYPVVKIYNATFKSIFSKNERGTNNTVKKVILPNTLKTIGSGAFWGCLKLSDIVIPEGVEHMGRYVFDGCRQLKYLKLPSSILDITEPFDYSLEQLEIDKNNQYYFVEDCILYNKKNNSVMYCLPIKKGKVIIPSNITSIRNSAFAGCIDITEIVIPNSVTSIGQDAFCNCTGLTKIDIPDSVTSIGVGAFAECSNLQNVVFGKGIKSIVNQTFMNCTKLTRIVFPNNINSIAMQAFQGCDGLTEVVIPESLTYIGLKSFYGCNNLNNIILDKNNPVFCLESDILYDKNNKEIIMCLTKKQGKVIIPPGITSIREAAFSMCKNITSIIIPGDITKIDKYTFEYCTGLNSIIIPDTIESIGIHAFLNCRNLTIYTKNSYVENYATSNNIKYIVDTSSPTINVSNNPTSWTNNNVTLTITITDNQSGISYVTLDNKDVILNDGKVIITTGENKAYKISAFDYLGNNKTQTVTVNKIDKNAPNMDVKVTKMQGTESNYLVQITATDGENESGIAGVKVAGNTATLHNGKWEYTVRGEGRYEIKVTDNAGNQKTQEICITDIQLNVSKSTEEWTNNNIDLLITAINNEENIDNVTVNGNKVNMENGIGTYTVTNNGTYEIVAVNRYGEKETKNITINNIDKTKPQLIITGIPTSWTNKDVILEVSSTDNDSGIKSIKIGGQEIELNNGKGIFTVGNNNGYVAVATDNAGNRTSEVIAIDKIDKKKPTIQVSGNPTEWTKDNVVLEINAEDNVLGSGIKFLTVNNKKISLLNNKANYTVTDNGIYEIFLIDNAGNTETVEILVDKIDKRKPTIQISGNPTVWTKDDVVIELNANDYGSGVSKVTVDGNIVNLNNNIGTYTLTQNGVYDIEVIDNIGNINTKYLIVDKIDKTIPNIQVNVNKIENTDEYILQINALDDGSGISNVTVDGNNAILNNNIWEYTVNQEGTFLIKATDNVGNSVEKEITVSNTDETEISLEVSYNTEWTNENVVLSISANKGDEKINNVTVNGDNVNMNDGFGTYIVTRNNTYEIVANSSSGETQTKEIVINTIDKEKPRLYYNINQEEWTNDNKLLEITVMDLKSGIKNVKIDGQELSLINGVYNFDIEQNGIYTATALDNAGNIETINIEVTRIDKIDPNLQITGYDNDWVNSLKILLTDEDSGISNLLINGQKYELNNGRLTYEIETCGAYTITGFDNAGNSVEAEIVINNVDKTEPNLEVNYNKQWTKDDVELTIIATDLESGLASVTVNGEEIDASREYIVRENGVYTIEVTDNIGNSIKKQIVVSNIDKTAPSLEVNYTKEWTKNNVELRIVSTDLESGLASVTVNGQHVHDSGIFKVSEKGTYNIISTNNAGNSTEYEIAINNIDKTAPNLEVNYSKEWTKDNVKLTIISTDAESGLSSVTVNGEQIDTSGKYVVRENGIYTIEAIDNVGNISEKEIIINNIDKTEPNLEVNYNKQWTKEAVELTIISTDAESGLSSVTVNGEQIDVNGKYTVTENGIYDILATDNAGNSIVKEIAVNNIDKSRFDFEINYSIDWTKDNIELTIVSTDLESGLASVTVNGEEIYTSGKYIVSENGIYDIIAVNNAGNDINRKIVINNIDRTAPNLEVNYNKEWTKDNLELTIIATDEGSGLASVTVNGEEIDASGKYTVRENGVYKIIATDNVGNIINNEIVINNIDKIAPNLEVNYSDEWTKEDVELTITSTDVGSGLASVTVNGEQIDVNEKYIVTENGTYTIEATDNVGNTIENEIININCIDNESPKLQIIGNKTKWKNDSVLLEIIADDKDSGISKVTINEQEIILKAGIGFYKATENGTYEIIAIDNVGNISTEEYTVDNIDRIQPNLQVNIDNTNWENENTLLKIYATDNESGISSVTVNGENIGLNNVETSLNVSNNGKYIIVATDNAGNITEKEIIVDKMDKNEPDLQISGNSSRWTNENIEIEIYATDNESGVMSVTVNGKEEALTNGKANVVITKNGDYEVTAVDTAGNMRREIIKINKIDKTLPKIEAIYNNSNTWTKDNIVLNIITQDNESGIADVTINGKEIQLTNGKSNIELTENGAYILKATDNAGNTLDKVITLNNIDKDAPLIDSINKNTEQLTKSVIITVNASDEKSGIKEYSYDNGLTWQNENTYTVTENGTYIIQVKDNVGNTSKENILISNINENEDPDEQLEDKDLKIEQYDIKRKQGNTYITAIQNDTTIEEIKENIKTNKDYEILDKNNNLVEEDSIVATGMKIVTDEAEYILVVKADLNSDGKTDISDLSVAASYLVGRGNLDTVYRLAGDINSDGIIDITDLSIIAIAVTREIIL